MYVVASAAKLGKTTKLLTADGSSITINRFNKTIQVNSHGMQLNINGTRESMFIAKTGYTKSQYTK